MYIYAEKLLYIRAPDVPRPRTRPRAHTLCVCNYPLMHRRERARAFNDRGCNPLHGRNLRVLRIPETAVRHLPPPEYLRLLAVE